MQAREALLPQNCGLHRRQPRQIRRQGSMGALSTRGAACCSSRKLLRSLISDTRIGVPLSTDSRVETRSLFARCMK
jgi:hypothetical protein